MTTPAKPDRHSLEPLVAIMAQLRGENGCPWDKEQTHQTLRRYLIEETYEAIEAIDQADWGELCNELGDILLQVVFHAQLASEADRFNIDDVVRAICDKMIRRHPHVFGNAEARDVDAVLKRWDQIKSAERKDAQARSVLDGIPSGLPALMFANEVQKRAARVGFDWPGPDGPLAKVEEELAEVRSALAEGSSDTVRREWGDLLFSLVNVARHLNIDAEQALRESTHKFIRRFQQVEQALRSRGQDPASLPLQVLDELWEQAKADETR